jgi:HAD superfamily hydrolase (TIGR01509 family)
MNTLRFLYFDLGMVLVEFSVERMLRQMADVSGASPEAVGQVLFGGDLQQRYEMGIISSREFYDQFCEHTGTKPDYHALHRAGAEIFSLNLSMLPIVAHLRQAGYRMGVLSNTCEVHWQYCFDRYRIISDNFEVYALSYRIGAVKPEAAIYQAAADLAGCRPEDIFFVDDKSPLVDGAKAAGFDAIHYNSAAQVAEELRRRGLRFNY